MTTIVATPNALFADSFCTAVPSFQTDKIQHIVREDDTQYLIGGAGDLAEIQFLAQILQAQGLDKLWALNMTDHWPPKILKAMDSEVIIVEQSGAMWLVDRRFVPMPVHEKYYTLGSGCEFAMAALDYGADPVAAIEYAEKRDPYTKAPIDMVEFYNG